MQIESYRRDFKKVKKIQENIKYSMLIFIPFQTI